MTMTVVEDILCPFSPIQLKVFFSVTCIDRYKVKVKSGRRKVIIMELVLKSRTHGERIYLARNA